MLTISPFVEITLSPIPVTGTVISNDTQTENMTNMTSGVPSPVKTSSVYLATTLLLLVSLSSLIFFF